MANPCCAVNSNPETATPALSFGDYRSRPSTHYRDVRRRTEVCPTPYQKGYDLPRS